MKTIPRLLVIVATALVLPGFACAQVARRQAPSTADGPAVGLYQDRNQYFQFKPPQGWVRKDYPDDPRSKVQFTDPKTDTYIRFIVRSETESTPETFTADKREAIDAMREKLGGRISSLTQSSGKFLGHPAHYVRLTMGRTAVDQTFFLANKLQFNIWHEAPTAALLHDSQALVARSLESIRVSGQGSAQRMREDQAARAIRLAQLLSARGEFTLALEPVEEALRDDPGNASLKQVQELLQQRRSVPDPLPR